MDLKKEMEQMLRNNILDFWEHRMVDNEHDGFYGRIDGHGELHADADKGCVLNARILWAFAAAYRVLKDKAYLHMAMRAKRYLIDHFIDKEQGGAYWSLDSEGNPKDEKKQTYAVGFCIYGLSELARATGDEEALAAAIRLYDDIERHAYDAKNNGYIEALTRSWQPIADMRLSEKDENDSRTMNTHLHILEPYTNLYRVWPDKELRERIVNLLRIFTLKFFNPVTHHLDLFFNDEWQGKRNVQSFGHDIEASWLMDEAVSVLADEELEQEMNPYIQAIAHAADEGLMPDGSMIYERWTDTGKTDTQRQWWVECECVIGHINLYQHFANKDALNAAEHCWQYIKDHLIAPDGEWYWSADAEGRPNLDDDRAGFWKCPYHNSRMVLETLERL